MSTFYDKYDNTCIEKECNISYNSYDSYNSYNTYNSLNQFGGNRHNKNDKIRYPQISDDEFVKTINEIYKSYRIPKNT